MIGTMHPELKEWFETVARSMLGRIESLYATYELCKTLIYREVQGDFVECGVFAGAEIAVMAKAVVMTGAVRTRKVHIFDSFQGIPEPTVEDQDFIRANQHAGGARCPQADVERNLRNWGIPPEILVWHPGWFKDTLPCDIGPIAYLRIDCDCYHSVRDSLGPLYPKVSLGGWVCIDDYPLDGCRKAMYEVIMPQPIYFQNVIPEDGK